MLLAPALSSASQETVPALRTETRVVEIDVSVRDSHGAPVTGRTKDDFIVKDAGTPRSISIFSAEHNSESAPKTRPEQWELPKQGARFFTNAIPADANFVPLP
jgi:hypothetical protein